MYFCIPWFYKQMTGVRFCHIITCQHHCIIEWTLSGSLLGLYQCWASVNLKNTKNVNKCRHDNVNEKIWQTYGKVVKTWQSDWPEPSIPRRCGKWRAWLRAVRSPRIRRCVDCSPDEEFSSEERKSQIHVFASTWNWILGSISWVKSWE